MPRSDHDLPSGPLEAARLRARAARLRVIAQDYPQDPQFQALVCELAAELEVEVEVEALAGPPDSAPPDLP